MASDTELHKELVSLYRRTGEATGYWPSYFLRSVRNDGGLTVAKKLLTPGRVSSGFDRLAAARRADLSVEFIARSERFSHLFARDELNEAESRLAELPANAFPKRLPIHPTSPDEVSSESGYPEGAVERIVVNRYERNAKARLKCIQRHGARCAVCAFDFEKRYGDLGKGFIHVHHKRPLARLSASYRVDPENDLVPVCPNCHAMLHRRDPPFDVEQLRASLRALST